MKRLNRKRVFPVTLVGMTLAIAAIAAPPALANDKLSIRDFVLTHGISDREPTDSVTSYSAETTKAVAFARISNSGERTSVNFVWRRDDEEHGTATMNIGTSSGWRTWSSANLSPGKWRVDLVDSAGTVLSSKAFTVGTQMGAADSQMNKETTSAVQSAPDTSNQPDVNSEPMIPSTAATGTMDGAGKSTGYGKSAP